MYIYIVICRKFFRDAIPVLNTPAAMTIIRKLITDKVVKDSEAEMWATSVAFISKPTRQMLEELEVQIFKLK